MTILVSSFKSPFASTEGITMYAVPLFSFFPVLTFSPYETLRTLTSAFEESVAEDWSSTGSSGSVSKSGSYGVAESIAACSESACCCIAVISSSAGSVIGSSI